LPADVVLFIGATEIPWEIVVDHTDNRSAGVLVKEVKFSVVIGPHLLLTE
jgi:hypothetical protein